MNETTIVRVRSHRAADRLKFLLGVTSLEWRWNMDEGNSFAEIPADRLDEAQKIPGVTRARPKGKLMRCYSFV